MSDLKLIDGNIDRIVLDENGNVESSAFTYIYKNHYCLKIITRFGTPSINIISKKQNSPIADIFVTNGEIVAWVMPQEFESHIEIDDIDEYYNNACVLKELVNYIKSNLTKLQKGEL